MDRLAAARAQRRQHDGANEPPHELSGYQNGQYTNGTTNNDTTGFLNEIVDIQDSIDRLQNNVNRIAGLHTRSMDAVGDVSPKDAAELEDLTTETRALANTIKDRIKGLESKPLTERDAQIRRNRTGLIRKNFLEALQRYQQVEQQSRAKALKPNATQEEVAAVVNNSSGQGDQIFANALTSSTRYGDSRVAYREVQERHQEILHMEQTLAELAQLFNDMAVLVEQQDATIVDIETTAGKVEADAKAGDDQVAIAVKHARSARRKRWICFFIFLFVIVVLGLALGLKFGLKQ
ncbi:hypothetical protein CCMSSC00406_0003263 [Pleurotus cornucopiae]|uniref:Uncharacterized protein n=1 Tax=Pleurotus cornucopiae TaxID=5321 RepID=A0ACB7J8L6_PLECO|nr:hypothetical protein CCMSSC00406_0003263 [Pleurotus cornucopiae]